MIFLGQQCNFALFFIRKIKPPNQLNYLFALTSAYDLQSVFWQVTYRANWL